jgi:glycosyltransferase involved in cell wall biosynthesis
MRIAIGCNTSQYAWMSRSTLIVNIINAGHTVFVIAPKDKYSHKFESIGAKFIDLPMRMNKNPISDIAIFLKFYMVLKKEGIELFLGYTIKPNIYGSLASHLLGVKVINNIAGLGTTFISENFTTQIVRFLYKLALAKSNKVFFQNNDDLDLFVENRLVKYETADLLPGSGVDLIKYVPTPQDIPTANFKFLLIARILWDKGIAEYVNAARIILKENKNVSFQLLGPLDVENPQAIPREIVKDWVAEGIINYLGVSDDVRIEISNADCVVLPSYREGTPRTLLESAAMGKPLITTNAVGCKDVVNHNINGFLCNVRDHIDLAEKMLMMVSLSKYELLAMGENSRKKVEAEFDEKIVIKKYMSAIIDIQSCL